MSGILGNIGVLANDNIMHLRIKQFMYSCYYFEEIDNGTKAVLN